MTQDYLGGMGSYTFADKDRGMGVTDVSHATGAGLFYGHQFEGSRFGYEVQGFTDIFRTSDGQGGDFYRYGIGADVTYALRNRAGFTPFLLALWTRQARTLKEPNSMNKILIGCVLLAVSYVVIAYAAWQGGAGKISWLWLLLYFVIITTGEIYSSPISQSLYSKVAPLRIASLMIAVNFLPNFLGGGLMQGWLGTFWEDMSHPAFFLMIAGIGLISAIMIWVMEKPLRPYLQKSHD